MHKGAIDNEKKKGIKIYKSKSKEEEGILANLKDYVYCAYGRSSFGFRFLGYSVGAPILDYLQNKDNYSSGTSEFIPSNIETSGVSNIDDSSVIDDSSASDDNPIINGKGNILAYTLNVDDLSSKSKLSSAISNIKTNTNATSVIVPLNQGRISKLFYRD